MIRPSFYEILGIDKFASQDEIKNAYRKSVKKYHPDANDTENAALFFRMVKEAYDVLSDEEKRSEYDKGNYNKPSSYADSTDFDAGKFADDIEDIFTGWRKDAENYWMQIKKKQFGVYVQLVIYAGYLYLLWSSDILYSIFISGNLPVILSLVGFALSIGVTALLLGVTSRLLIKKPSFMDGIYLLFILNFAQSITTSMWITNEGIGRYIVNFIIALVLNSLSCRLGKSIRNKKSK